MVGLSGNCSFALTLCAERFFTLGKTTRHFDKLGTLPQGD